VGVRSSQLAADAGGGHTFEREIFESLLELAPSSPHRFVAMGGLRDLPPPPGDPPPLEVVPRRGLAGRGLRRALRGADHEVEETGVDVVWNLSPFLPPTEVPFLTVVWDLQHRLQPFFPEVSRGGEWARREAHFSRLLKRAAAVITGTEAGRQEIAGFYQVPEERIHVLPHPTPRFALAAGGATPGDGAGPPRDGHVLYPAQFWPHKNHVSLLQALRLLRDEGLVLPLELVGSDKGNQGMVRRLAADLGLAEQVRFRGFVPLEELVALYRGASCLAYPSLFGPENLPPLEAFALGCPVVAADVPGSEEQLGDAALRVDATRPAELAAALHSVHCDAALRAALVERGRARALRFTGHHFVEGVFRILDGLAPLVRCWRPGEPR
jgi:glycosyltransferase involved in cell wall biosynthesis